jgi:hypothetical protein
MQRPEDPAVWGGAAVVAPAVGEGVAVDAPAVGAEGAVDAPAVGGGRADADQRPTNEDALQVEAGRLSTRLPAFVPMIPRWSIPPPEETVNTMNRLSIERGRFAASLHPVFFREKDDGSKEFVVIPVVRSLIEIKNVDDLPENTKLIRIAGVRKGQETACMCAMTIDSDFKIIAFDPQDEAWPIEKLGYYRIPHGVKYVEMRSSPCHENLTDPHNLVGPHFTIHYPSRPSVRYR